MTPDFPCLASGFSRQLRRLRTTLGKPLHQFEPLFAPYIPRHRLAQEDQGAHSRDRRWNLRLVFWTFLWQVAQAGSSCREAIRQAQSLCRLQERPVPPDKTSPYCQARGRLPLERLEDIHRGLCREAEAAVSSRDLWCGHRVQVVDGSSCTLADTLENQAVFPQQSVQKPGCGFPIMTLVALFSLATGMITAWATGSWGQHELALLQRLWDHLRPNDVLLADRGFGTWALLSQCSRRKVHAVFRLRGRRRGDFRRGRRLSADQRLVQWEKPRNRSKTVSAWEWDQLPDVLTLRLVRCTMNVKGFRTRQIVVVTTLLDTEQYPPSELSRLYLRRWEMELSLRDLKTTMQMEHLSCMRPDYVERELRMHLLAHNLVRRVMLQCARVHRVPLTRVSFAGALATCRRYGEALLQARSQAKRKELLQELLRVIAEDPVPLRPGRREPRALKRRPKPYPYLTCHRREYKEIPHKNRYWDGSPCRRRGATGVKKSRS